MLLEIENTKETTSSNFDTYAFDEMEAHGELIFQHMKSELGEVLAKGLRNLSK